MITSKQNALIKEIKSLADKKFRDRLGVFVIEGTKSVKEAVELGLSIRNIIATEKGAVAISHLNLNVETVTDDLFLYVSEEKCPQGVLAVVNKPNKDLVSPNGKCLLLDGVSDPSNVGAILRTAAAAGYNEVYMTDDSADAYSNKAVRASMTGVLRVNVMRAPRERLLEVINLPLWIADMNGESVFTAKPNGDFCLVIGNEGNGVSRQVKDKASFTVSIPMDNGVESLNAAVSAGILMYNLKNKV